MNNVLEEYLNYNPEEDLTNFVKIPTETWLKLGEQKALEVFHKTSDIVPAYKDFLKKNSIKPEKILTIEDFKKVPIITKDNYLRKYGLEDLAENGNLDDSIVYFMTSGSTGNSFYWPRPADLGSLKGVELLLNYYFNLGKYKTLLINSFAMGPWGAGEVFHFATKLAALKRLNITVISPGTNVELFISIFRDLAPKYEQIIVTGYASFLKDLLDSAEQKGVDFKKYKTGFVTGGEKFSENWRSYINNKLGTKNIRSVASVYGTSEAAVVGISSVFTDFLRIYLNNNKKESKKFFQREDLPSLVHFIPPVKYLETVNEEIIMTTPGKIPLVRYNSKDTGIISSPEEIIKRLPEEFMLDFKSISKEPVFNLPIITIDGRSDRTIILFGANIYPEQIQEVLNGKELQQILTGRFIAERFENEESDPFLRIILELKSDSQKTTDLKFFIQEKITQGLRRLNSEYNNVLNTTGSKAKPLIELENYNSEKIRISSGKGTLVKINDPS